MKRESKNGLFSYAWKWRWSDFKKTNCKKKTSRKKIRRKHRENEKNKKKVINCKYYCFLRVNKKF